jgi:hypothetical protein
MPHPASTDRAKTPIRPIHRFMRYFLLDSFSVFVMQRPKTSTYLV